MYTNNYYYYCFCQLDDDNGQSRRSLCNSYNSYGYLVKKQNEILAVLKEQEPIALDEDKDHLIPIKLEIELDNEIKYVIARI